MLRNTLHDRFVVGGLDVAHTIEQGIYIALVHPVLGIVGKDVVGMAGTTDELARNAGISLRNSNAERRFHLGDSLPDGIARLFDIIDPAGLDPLDRFWKRRLRYRAFRLRVSTRQRPPRSKNRGRWLPYNSFFSTVLYLFFH